MTSAPSEQLAICVRGLLRAADHPTGAAGTAAQWRTLRDHWLDVFDPRDSRELGESEVRDLIDFLSEAGPSKGSRKTPGEWSSEVDALVPELLFLGAS